MVLLGFSLSILGLILDIIGFAGIFYLKPKPMNKIPPLNIAYLSVQSDLSFIVERINNGFEEFNDNVKENETSENKFFISVVLGFLSQIVGLIITFSISPPIP